MTARSRARKRAQADRRLSQNAERAAASAVAEGRVPLYVVTEPDGTTTVVTEETPTT